jgi:hypothetical protein
MKGNIFLYCLLESLFHNCCVPFSALYYLLKDHFITVLHKDGLSAYRSHRFLWNFSLSYTVFYSAYLPKKIHTVIQIGGNITAMKGVHRPIL